MADTLLHFRLGSTFDGQGFVAANKEIQNAAKGGKSLSGVLGNVIGEAQKLDGAMGKVAGAAGNVVNGFAQMGIIGGIVAGAKSAMDMFFESAKKDLDEMVRRNKAEEEAQRKRLQATVDAHIKSVHDANEATKSMGAEAVKQFDETAQAAVRASQLIAQTDIARANNSIAKVQVEKLNAIIKEETDSGKALVAAKYDLQIAMMKAAQSEDRNAEKTAAAQQAILDAQGHLKHIQNQVALAESAYAQAKKEEALLATLRNADSSKVAGEVKAAETALKEARKQERQSVQAVNEATERMKAVEIGVATERENQKASILQARMALDKVNEAERKAAEAREKEAKAAEEAARKLAAQKEAEQRESEVRRDAEGQIAGLQNEIKNLTNEIKQINERNEVAKNGVATERGVNNWGPGYAWRTDANGVPDNFIDWQRAMRFAERAERDRATREKRDSAFQKKMQELQERLEKRGEKALSDREKTQLKAWQEFQNAKNGRQRREQEIKEKQKMIDVLRQRMADDIKMIKEDLKMALEVR